jgi:hypothetical protein
LRTRSTISDAGEHQQAAAPRPPLVTTYVLSQQTIVRRRRTIESGRPRSIELESTNVDIARRRLANQHLTAPTLTTPAAIVRVLGAVQAQDYAGAKWALGIRTRGADDAVIEQAVSDGSIIRTHVLRPTWHFVAPGDLRWMLALTAPRVSAQWRITIASWSWTTRSFAGATPR